MSAEVQGICCVFLLSLRFLKPVNRMLSGKIEIPEVGSFTN